MKSIFTAFIAIPVLFSSASAQQVLTLHDALAIALKKSYAVQSAGLVLLNSKRSLEADRLGLRTSVDMTFNLPSYSQTLSNQFNPLTGTEQFFNYGSTTYQGQLNVTQPIVYTNGTFTLSGLLWKRSQFSSGVQIPSDYYTNLSLSFQQPLFTFNTLKANLTSARINLEKAERNYSIVSNDIIYNVTTAFYNLYQAKENVAIARDKVKQTEASYETAKNEYKAGLIAEVDALQFEVELASSRNDLLAAENNFNDQMDGFKLLIGLRLRDSVDISANLKFKPVYIDLQQAISYALASRNEIKNDESNIELGKLNVDQIKAQGNISAMLTANYGLNKDDNLFEELYHNFAGSRSVALTVTVPILDWGANHARVESAEASLAQDELNYKNEREQIKNEIITLVERIKSDMARVETLSQSVAIAQKSYDISIKRFQEGNITSLELQQVQLSLTNAKTSSLNALIDYELALADLRRRTLHDFESQ